MANQTNTAIDWRILAEDDLSVAEYLIANMRPIPTNHIAFLCQQAAEKYLKGALVVFGIEPPYTHDLILLYNLSEKQLSSYVSIFSSCSIVTQFSVQPRYDRGLSISDDDIRLTLAHTKIIRDFLQKEVPELFIEETESNITEN
ncbi:MAG: HEPN domain-containing protein [Treponema sp.]|nr:HEPN domain-containing protein [Treponema sp.]